ncbi:GerMN domain-containing protein [uncultured Brachyspira sp.]|uniref:GerMN domain-containing protein n=1 Tax=uncultured Brachyspira sp. TaxID=221953 RepID=UPI002619ED93|nr:GerMN domain-containing protein [uncultured Brachyspira sp.]
MPRYEQLKSKSKSISYTRQIRNESKEINLKKPIIISAAFIIAAALIFTVVKKYSPMVDIAIKDFFSINHKEALVLESDGITEDQNKMSFLSNIPLFNFFIKTDTNETLSVMAYETNSKIETSLDMMSENITNSSIITKESLLPFFNNSGVSNSILYDSGYIDYGNNHESVILSNNMNTLNRIPENDIVNDNEENIIVADIENTPNAEEEKTYNYLEQMILENRQNDNTQDIKTTNIITNKQNNTAAKKSIFDDILKPKDNTTKRETTTMKPASTTTFSTRPPASYVENTTKKDNSSTNYDFNIDKYLNNNDNKENVINNNQVNNNTINNDRNINNNRKENLNNNIKENINNNTENTKKDLNNNAVNNNNVTQNRKDIMQKSVYTITNSLDKSNIDYNRVINDMVNPNNNVVRENNNNIVNDSKVNNNINKENNNNSIINKPSEEKNNIKENKESNIVKDNELKDNIKETANNIIKNNTIKNNNTEYKKEIIKKAQTDINNYNIKKANNNITRDLKERKLKENSNEGIYLVEYSESTGSITLIFRERKFNNKSSVEEAIKELLVGATDEENNRNIISCIPKDTELLDIFIENNTVYLNFNENFEFNPLGNEGTMVQIYQFVYTATQFEGIDNVIFLINGQLNETIGAEGAIENMPFSRFE